MCTVSPAKVTEISHAAQVRQAERERRVACAALAAELVVVGQRPQLDAVGLGARGQRLGLSVPSETVEWQCRSALTRFGLVTRGF